MKPPGIVCLDLPCVGPMSNPPQVCSASIVLPLPFTADDLTKTLARVGWFVTVVSEPGEEPVRLATLCAKCTTALLPPDVVAEAQRILKEKAPS